tara:strand:+ start:1526 stop:2095 length:570 start_codon:yes stop_codon:yes gene_type:complete
MLYSIGHIYKIICTLDSNICYIGCTFNELRHRWQGHKTKYKRGTNRLSITKYFDKYGIDNFKIIKIKSYSVIRENKHDFKHLHTYELLWINNTKNCVNTCLPFNPLKKISVKEYKKKYYQSNKDDILDKRKLYYENNKGDISNQKKKYRDKNKQKLNENINCECGGKYQFRSKARHFKSKKHLSFNHQK